MMTIRKREVVILAVSLLLSCIALGWALFGGGSDVEVLSRTDLTGQTTVYMIRVGGDQFVVVNGIGKVAICPR